MTITLRKAIAGLAAAGSLTLAGAAPALAGTGPGNAPTAVTGTFFDCTNTNGASGTYVINAGNSNAQTWDAAILTFKSGGAGVFIENAQALSVNGSPLPPESKGSGSAPGPVQCSIKSKDGTVTGTVWGKIVTTG